MGFLEVIDHPDTENPFTALETAVALIRNCSDLSERQLVVILDYTMCHVNPVEISKTFNSFDENQIHQLYAAKEAISDNIVSCKERNTLDNAINISSKATDGKNIVHHNKIVLDGLVLVLRMVIGYSECNETVLRVALGEELSSS